MSQLSPREDLDFHYLLALMPPLHDVPEFAWLPELFSIVGHENLINLCKYAGGETIRIPTLSQLDLSVQALQWYYDVYIQHTLCVSDIPSELVSVVFKIKEIFDAECN